jgi:hypothetical protein
MNMLYWIDGINSGDDHKQLMIVASECSRWPQAARILSSFGSIDHQQRVTCMAGSLHIEMLAPPLGLPSR